MTDIEKVIKGLQCIIDGTVRCTSCGYAIDEHGHYSCQQECAKDALALLKEQEPKPVKITKNAYDYLFYRCPNCERLFHDPWELHKKYCCECGQAVKWNESD